MLFDFNRNTIYDNRGGRDEVFFSFRVIKTGKTPVKLKLLFTRVKMVPCVHHSREVIELVFGRTKETLRKNFIRMSRVSPRLLL